MKKYKFQLTVVILISVILIQALPTYAYELLPSSQRWGSDVHWDKDYYFYLSYETQVNNTMYAWNNTPTKAFVWYDAGCGVNAIYGAP